MRRRAAAWLAALGLWAAGGAAAATAGPRGPGAGGPPAAAGAESSPLLAAMAQELDRSLAILGRQPQPPYFLAYEVHEVRRTELAAAFGRTVAESRDHLRQLDIDLRVGKPELDNTHALRGERREPGAAAVYQFLELPIEDDAGALRGVLWFHTDRAYKSAVERLTEVETNVRVKSEESDPSPDFSPAPPVDYVQAPLAPELEVETWRRRLERHTDPFARRDHLYDARAELVASVTTRWYVNSEGIRLQTSRRAYRLQISAFTKAADGMELPRHESFFAYSAADLPDDATLSATVAAMIADLEALRAAPVVDPYTGPALLSGRAAGVFFHEVLGHRVEGHRLKNEADAQTLKQRVGERLLPAEFDVVFDPTVERAHGADLAGYYAFDNEGVAARPVTVVDDGVLAGFLMSRSPIAGHPESNGHGRRQPGFRAVARQSNLLVRVDEPLTAAAMEGRMLDLLAASGREFGLVFEDIEGGYTLTGRDRPNAFNVVPVMVYRLYRDGRRELVRGVDLIGTPLTAFSQIVAGDDRVEVFNGTCGAESGAVPVAAVAPGVLVAQIEVQKVAKSQDRPPILEPPPAEPAP